MQYGPKIVRSGLILHLDAADRKSYPGTGENWFDISGNSKVATMAATNKPIFATLNGVKCFQGTDLANQHFAVSNYTFPISGRTYECWVNLSFLNSGWQTFMDDNSDERLLFSAYTNGELRVYPGVTFGAQFTANVWAQAVITMAGDLNSTIIGYINGSSVGSAAYGYSLTSGTGTLYIMGDNTAGQSESLHGYMAIARAYNRVLSASEILQNFNATKSRFGL